MWGELLYCEFGILSQHFYQNVNKSVFLLGIQVSVQVSFFGGGPITNLCVLCV